MGKVPQPNIRWRGAHPNNFTVGRPGGGLNGDQTFHHVVGTRESAVIVFNNPTRGASSHFVVGGDIIDQCVDIKDTAWCDGNWDHNIRAITVEHEGGWNGTGPYSDAMYEQAAWLCAWLRENYGIARYVRHRDVSLKSTACPGGLDVERIWRRSQEIIDQWNKPAEQPEWIKNRQPYSGTVYAQVEGLRLINLNDPNQYADERVFPRNTSFELGSVTTVAGVKYVITKSSTDLNKPNGIRLSEIATTPYAPPQQPAPQPTTPEWKDSLIDEDNRKMYVIRETLLIDLEKGTPVIGSDGQEIRFRAGAIIDDVSAHTIVAGKTYYLTEYSFSKKIGRGILANDLSLNPESTPPGTPANPDMSWLKASLEALIEAIKAIIAKLPLGK